EIYLIRHGQTDYNKKRIIQGRGVDSDINAMGRKQAQAFYDAFRNTPFDRVFSSTLKRTQQTLEPFKTLYPAHHAHEGLDELHWGMHEGKVATKDMHQEYLSIIESWKKGELSRSMPGGESPLDLKTRQEKFIKEALSDFEGKMLICSHGRAIRSLLCNLTNCELSKMDDFPHDNVALYKLTYSNGFYDIDLFNYKKHLLHLYPDEL
ncbi:MAG: histidine phosphatase family protein, partial [Chitinophagales bacterium]